MLRRLATASRKEVVEAIVVVGVEVKVRRLASVEEEVANEIFVLVMGDINDFCSR